MQDVIKSSQQAKWICNEALSRVSSEHFVVSCTLKVDSEIHYGIADHRIISPSTLKHCIVTIKSYIKTQEILVVECRAVSQEFLAAVKAVQDALF